MILKDRYNSFYVFVDNDENADPEIFLDLWSNSKFGIFFILYLDGFYRIFVDESQIPIKSQMVPDLTVLVFQILFIFEVWDLRQVLIGQLSHLDKISCDRRRRGINRKGRRRSPVVRSLAGFQSLRLF